MSTTTTSITTTTSTSSTTTTPVKLFEKNNKVEETKETTTTTTKTTTIVTPIKEEPKKKKVINKVWNDKDYIRAQLFRDLSFGRYGRETKATEIHGDPDREYYQYNLQAIQRKVREVRLLVKAYHEGVWLDEDPSFKEQCQLYCLPTAEEKTGRVDEYKRWEKLHPRRMALCEQNGLSSSDLQELLSDFVALSVKSGIVKV